MIDKEQKTATKNFAEYWKDKGDEKIGTQSFWIMLLREVFSVAESEKIIEFEKRVKNETTNSIDCYIEFTKVIIEQKALGKNLRKVIRPPELRKAHRQNDFAVMSAYGFDKKITESECVAELMKMYQKLTK
ncbi:MAG: hypothetical protein NC177_12665 [Ruminococcus flavefaciens]|nr:hypothetical protein [Ruminococcus flavefaciens]